MLDRFALKSVLEKITTGDREALGILYRDRADQLYALTTRMLGQSELAAEAMENTFVEIWRRAKAGQAAWEMPDLEMISIARAKAGDLAGRSPEKLGADAIVEMTDPVNDGVASFELLVLLQSFAQLSTTSRNLLTYAFYERPIRDRLQSYLGLSQQELTPVIRRCYAEFLASSAPDSIAEDREADLIAMQAFLGMNDGMKNLRHDALRHAWELRLAPLAELLKPLNAPQSSLDRIQGRVNADASTSSAQSNTRTSETWRAMLYVAIAAISAGLVYLGLIAISDDAAARHLSTLEENLR